MRLASGKPEFIFRGQESGALGLGDATLIGGVSAGDFDVPLRVDGALQIYFAGPRAERHVSAAALESGAAVAEIQKCHRLHRAARCS